ncbi:hypothetical protein ALQ47_01389 [Pseudomonas cichorii]|nr:hypothetical protein ALQ47_01389 [Pseudomonas cichorii]
MQGVDGDEGGRCVYVANDDGSRTTDNNVAVVTSTALYRCPFAIDENSR